MPATRTSSARPSTARAESESYPAQPGPFALRVLSLAGGWPSWVWAAPYDASNHPLSQPLRRMVSGANCQRFAYVVLNIFGHEVPLLRSSELWASDAVHRIPVASIRPLDLILFNASDTAYGAHVGVVVPDDEVLHLSRTSDGRLCGLCQRSLDDGDMQRRWAA